MEDRIRSIETTLRKSIEARGATTPEARQVIYDAAERALTRSIARDGHEGSERELMLRQSLAVATKRIEQNFTEPETAPETERDIGMPLPDDDLKEEEIPMTQPSDMKSPPPARSGGSGKMLTALLLLVVIGAGGAYFYTNQQQPQVATIAAGTEPDGYVSETPLTLTEAEGFELSPNTTDDYVTITGVDTPPQDAVPPGVTLSNEYERMFAGKDVTVTVTARSSATDGADSVGVVYYTLGQGNSGWQMLPLTSEFTEISIDYAVPAVTGEPGEEYVGIAPAVGQSVDVRSVRVSLKDPG